MATRSLPQGSADRLTDDQGKARPSQLLPPRLQPSVSLLSLSSFPVLGCAGCSAAVPVSSWTAAACCVGARSPTRYAGCSGHPGCCGYRGQWQMWQQFAGKPGEPIPDPIPELAWTVAAEETARCRFSFSLAYAGSERRWMCACVGVNPSLFVSEYLNIFICISVLGHFIALSMRFHARSCAIAIVLVNRLSTVLTTIVPPVWHVAYGMFRIAVALATAGMSCLALSSSVLPTGGSQRPANKRARKLVCSLKWRRNPHVPSSPLSAPTTTPHRRSPFSCPPAVDASCQRGPTKASGKPHSSPTRFKLSAAAQFSQISESIQHAKRRPSITHHFTSINASANTLRSKTTSFIHSYTFALQLQLKLQLQYS